MQLSQVGAVRHINGPSEYINNVIKEECRKMADEATSAKCTLPRANVLFALHEFMKNTLHGENPVIEAVWLPDSSLLLIAKDKAGKDQLDQKLCFGIATSMIRAAVGHENYVLRRHGETFESYLRIPISKTMVEAH